MAIDALSHVAPILPTDVEQRIGNLAERGHLDGLHQFLKHVPALSATSCSCLSAACVASPSTVCRWTTRSKQASFSSGVARANSISKSSAADSSKAAALGFSEGVHADDGQRTVVLEVLVVH